MPENLKYASLFLLIFIFKLNLRSQSDRLTISVLDSERKTPIEGCLVSYNGYSYLTDEQGVLDLYINSSVAQICFHLLGYRDTCSPIDTASFQRYYLERNSEILLEVQVLPNSENRSKASLLNSVLKTRVVSKDLQAMGLLLGEEDLFKGLVFTPGVQSGNPGSSEVHIRGSDHYGNSILLDGVPIYNVLHLNGATSPFPNQGINSLTIFKQGIQSMYGFGTSAILNLETKNAPKQTNFKDISVGFGSLEFTIGCPLKKGSSGFLLSQRLSTVTPILYITNQITGSGSSENLSFYDIILKTQYQLDSFTHFSQTNYFSIDGSGVTTEDYLNSANVDKRTINWASSLKFKKRLAPNFFFDQIAFISLYDYNYRRDFSGGERSANLDYRLTYSNIGLKSNYKVGFNNQNLLNFGFGVNFLMLHGPRISSDQNLLENLGSNQFFNYYYLEYTHKISDQLNMRLGLRSELISSIGGYHKILFLPRGLITYSPKDYLSIFFSYDHLSQSTHIVRRGVLTSPEDFITMSSQELPAQESVQISAGLNSTFGKVGVQAQLYYRNLISAIDIDYSKPHFFNEPLASMANQGLVLTDPSNALVTVRGAAYGVDAGFRGAYKRVRYSASYSWTKSVRNSEFLNHGLDYNYHLNREHNFQSNIAIRFKRTNISKIIEVGASWFYGSGFFTQFPLEFIYSPNLPGSNTSVIPAISERNSSRLPSIDHLSLSINLIKETASYTRRISIGVYNAYLSPVTNSYIWRNENTLSTEGFLPFIPSITYKISWL